MNNKNQNLPKGWLWVKLGEVCETTSGGTPSRKNLNYYNGNIPWVKSGELNYNIIYDTEEKITEEAVQNSSAKVFPKGTLLIALYGATIGKLAFLGIDAATNQAVCGIFCSALIYDKYLFNYLIYKRNDLINQAIGGAQPNISQGILQILEIPLPPLAEQHRIVAKIEELFSSLDKAVERLKAAREQLKIYRQAVLKWAFEGRFTHKDIKQGELPKGWVWKKLGEVGKIETGKTPSKNNPEYYSDEYPFYKPTDLEAGDNVTSSIDGLSQKGLGKTRYAPEFSILVTCIGTIGKTGFIRRGGGFNQQINAIIPNAKMFPKFIYYQAISQKFQEQIKKNASATTLPILNKSRFENLEMVVCDKSEQEQIVSEIEKRFSVAEKVEESIRVALEKAERLRQSILKKAFEGKLVPQDPNDEPASVLLEKIKAEKKQHRKQK